MRSRGLPWIAVPVVVFGGWQAYLNKNVISNYLVECPCLVERVVKVEPSLPSIPVSQTPPLVSVDQPTAPVQNDEDSIVSVPAINPIPVLNCTLPPPKAKASPDDVISDAIAFIFDIADDATVNKNRDLADCAIKSAMKISMNDRVWKMPKQKLQDIHTRMIYTLRRLHSDIKPEQNAVLGPWLSRMERQIVTSIDKTANSPNCK